MRCRWFVIKCSQRVHSKHVGLTLACRSSSRPLTLAPTEAKYCHALTTSDLVWPWQCQSQGDHDTHGQLSLVVSYWSVVMAYVFLSAFSKVISTVVAPDKISIDNWCFKLFYRITPMILGVSTVLVCCRSGITPDIFVEYNFDKDNLK